MWKFNFWKQSIDVEERSFQQLPIVCFNINMFIKWYKKLTEKVHINPVFTLKDNGAIFLWPDPILMSWTIKYRGRKTTRKVGCWYKTRAFQEKQRTRPGKDKYIPSWKKGQERFLNVFEFCFVPFPVPCFGFGAFSADVIPVPWRQSWTMIPIFDDDVFRCGNDWDLASKWFPKIGQKDHDVFVCFTWMVPSRLKGHFPTST